MSPSKKANKKESEKKVKSGQKPKSARSSRVISAEVQPKMGGYVQAKKAATKASHTPKNMPKPTAVTEKGSTLSQNVKENTSVVKQVSKWQTNLLRVVALLTVLGITLYIYGIRDQVEEFERFGYAGIFLIALMANATVLLPAPGVAIIYAMGAVFNPLWVGLAAGTGGALGELSGYLAGFSGQAVVEKTEVYNRFQPWVEKYGGWAILVLSAIPNPFFDIAGIAAGIAKMPIRSFLIFTWAGQIIKMTLFAFAGHYSLEWLTNYMS